jgi:serine/threonine protein kinase
VTLSDAAVARLREITEMPDAGERYAIVRLLGRGGTGAVFEAEDRLLGRRVAMKVVATEHDRTAGERMRAEAKTIAALEHPGIVPLHDAGELPDGRLFYTMKLVRGVRLDQLPMSSALERLRVFLRICEAVAFAHARGVVHCDLKPQNIMTGEFGEVLVMDWGTHLAGTRGFMAPEQERGGDVAPAADVYALGCILRQLIDSPPRPLRAVIAKATSHDAAARYSTAGELGDEIARYLEGAPLVAYRESMFERAGRWLSRNRALVTVVAAYLIMRVLIFFLVQR